MLSLNFPGVTFIRRSISKETMSSNEKNISLFLSTVLLCKALSVYLQYYFFHFKKFHCNRSLGLTRKRYDRKLLAIIRLDLTGTKTFSLRRILQTINYFYALTVPSRFLRGKFT